MPSILLFIYSTNRKRMFQKAVFFIAFAFLFSCGNTGKKKDCSRYKNGSFFYMSRQNNVRIPFRIERADTLQVETNQQTKDIFRYNVRWTGDCNYELRYIDGTYAFTAAQLQAKKKEVRKTIITGTTDLYYLFESKTNTAAVVKDTLWLMQ